MAYELRNNSGSLFRNKRKEQENHPDSTGTVMIAGVEYFINGWTKTTKDGDKWVSLSFKPKDGKSESKPAARNTRRDERDGDGFDSDLPF